MTRSIVLIASAVLTATLFWCDPALAQGTAAPVRVTLPFQEVSYLDGVKFSIQVPGNWNRTLLVYIQASKSGPPPPEPLLVPRVVDTPVPALDATLLARGYALAASEIGTTDWQLKESVQDTFALTTYFRARVGEPRRVILWGQSLGGLTALRLVEDFPRSFDAAIPMCATMGGWNLRMDRNLDFALAYEAVFGWPEAWGPMDGLRPGLDFVSEVMPRMKTPATDGSNRGEWEFIRLVFGLPNDALYGTCPLYKIPMWAMIFMTSTQLRADTYGWAAGPSSQNQGHRYTLTADEKAYLAGLGVNADALLEKMNARIVEANAPAREWVRKFGDFRGLLKRPVLTMKNTLDGQAEVQHEPIYAAAVNNWGASQNLMQMFVTGVGHCAFNSKQVLTSLAVVEQWLDTGIKPEKTMFPESDGFAPGFVPAPWK